MKMNVSLTADEMLTLMDAVVEAADERGYDVEQDDIQLELFEIMDAGLASLGIEIVEDEDEEIDFEDEDEDEEEIDFEDEDEDEDEDIFSQMIYETANGKKAISKTNADMILKTIKITVFLDNDIPFDKKQQAIEETFIEFCTSKGIEVVDMGE